MISIRVSKPDVRVYYMNMIEDEEEEETIPTQISPVFKTDGDISNEQFEVTFLATVPALGLQTYFVRQLKPEEGKNDEMSVATVKIFNSNAQPFQVTKTTFETFLKIIISFR